MIKYRYFVLMILIGLLACKKSNKSIQKDIIIDDYSVEITFSSFWDCGVFKKYVLNNLRDQDPSEKPIYKEFNLYSIIIKGNCKPPIHSDTLMTKLTKIQSDSLFDFSNSVIDNFKLINRVKPYQRIEMVEDGADVKIEICLMNKCKSATYYHYGDLKDISPEMERLMKYINVITKK